MLAVVLGASLAGCGGGDAGAPAAAPPALPAPPPPPAFSMTFTPSLGKVLNAVVQLKLANGTVIGTLNTGSTGTVTFANVPQSSGPLLVEVLGGANATYYDEATNTYLPFGPDRILRTAVVASAANSNVAVTAFTTMAVARANALTGGLTAANIAAANGAIAAAFSVPDISTAPSLAGSAADVAALQNTPAGQYALRLAALAKLALTQNASIGAPALAMLEAMTRDMADGVLDGKQGADSLSNLPYVGATFGSAWLAATQALGANNANLLSFLSANNFGVAWSGAPVVPPAPAPGTGTEPVPDTPPVNMPPTGVWVGGTLTGNGNCRVTLETNGVFTMTYDNTTVSAHYSGVSPDAYQVSASGTSYAATSDQSLPTARIVTVNFKAGALDVAFVIKAGPPPVSVMCHNFVKQ
ncbi:hypothetical protein [Massilia glaciei]|uniref:hypothetical protein n=1 Tax=Massilia glaciei TaxID=1524097 RepID=UPI000D102B84|nr:hypothetical protein [Massilia glaciei]